MFSGNFKNVLAIGFGQFFRKDFALSFRALRNYENIEILLFFYFQRFLFLNIFILEHNKCCPKSDRILFL